jgi:hypothetical protein
MQEKGDRNFAGITLFCLRDSNSLSLAGYGDISNVRGNSEATEKFVLHRKLMELVAGKGEVEITNNCTQAIYYSSLFVKLSISLL